MPQDGLLRTSAGTAEAILTQHSAAPRRKWPRILAVLCAVLLLLPLLAGAAVLAFLDPAGQIPRIEQAVQRATGREAKIRSLRIQWSLAPTVLLDGFTLANAPDGSELVMLDVSRAEARVALLPLLSRRIEVARVTLDNPRLLLETDAAGRGNWLFAPQPAPTGSDSAASSGRSGTGFATELRRVDVGGGTLRLRDGVTGRVLDVALPRASLDATQGGTQLSADVSAGGVAVAVLGKAGPLPLLGRATSGTPAPWPLDLEIQGAGFRGRATGTLPELPRRDGAAFTLEAQVADLSAFVPTLPVRDIVVSARWSPAGFSDITAKAGQSDLSSAFPGLVLRGATVTAQAVGQPARVELDALLDGAPLTVSASVLPRPEGGSAALRGLAVAGPFGDVAGDAAVSWAPRPALRGTLVSQRLDLDAIRALQARLAREQPATTAALPTTPPAPGGSAPEHVIPDTPVPFAPLRVADADLRWSAASVRLGGSGWQELEARAVLADGRLRLDPFTAASSAGRFDGSLLADAGRPEPSVALKLRLPGVALAPLVTALGRADALSGTAQGEADLRATGSTLRALATSLDGTVALTLVDGEIDIAAIAPALAGLLRSAGIPASLRGRSAIRCLALFAAAERGSVQIRTAYLDSSRLRLSAEGGVNLADEALALRLRPALRLGATEAAVPLRLEGTLARPQTHLDAVSPGRVGAVIGAQRAQGDECGPALLAARSGREGPMPAAEPPAASAPADVLRRLLR